MPTYSKGCYFTHNFDMVDKADAAACAFNGQCGGTAYTVNYALKQNKVIIQIDPATCLVSILGKREFDPV